MPETINAPEVEKREQFKLQGEQLATKVKELLHEGNVRRLILKHEGHTILEIPVTLGIAAVVLAPVIAAVGVIGVMVTDCTLEVVRMETPN
jgi:uncharacterized membrane protein